MSAARRTDVELVNHTVLPPEGGPRKPGFLVRSVSGKRELGYLWCLGQRWAWMTPQGDAFGDRATKRAALDVLVDVQELAAGMRMTPGVRYVVTDDAPSRPSAPKPKPKPVELGTLARNILARADPKPAPKPTPKPATPPAPTRIQWADMSASDLTAAVASALKKESK